MKNVIKFSLFIFLSVAGMDVYAQNYGNAAPSSDSRSIGSPLSMVGWHLENKPMIVTNPKQELGKITYTIEIDSVGNLLTVKVREQTISDELAQRCEAELRKLSFVKNENNVAGAPISKGTVTFVFRVN